MGFEDIFTVAAVIFTLIFIFSAQKKMKGLGDEPQDDVPHNDTDGTVVFSDLFDVKKEKSDDEVDDSPVFSTPPPPIPTPPPIPERSKFRDVDIDRYKNMTISSENLDVEKSADDNIEQQSKLLNDFDLKKAVIYAEIMQPKWKE